MCLERRFLTWIGSFGLSTDADRFRLLTAAMWPENGLRHRPLGIARRFPTIPDGLRPSRAKLLETGRIDGLRIPTYSWMFPINHSTLPMTLSGVFVT